VLVGMKIRGRRDVGNAVENLDQQVFNHLTLLLGLGSSSGLSCPEDNFPVRRTILLPNFSEITMGN
jgi:hypothetical protein